MCTLTLMPGFRPWRLVQADLNREGDDSVRVGSRQSCEQHLSREGLAAEGVDVDVGGEARLHSRDVELAQIDASPARRSRLSTATIGVDGSTGAPGVVRSARDGSFGGRANRQRSTIEARGGEPGRAAATLRRARAMSTGEAGAPRARSTAGLPWPCQGRVSRARRRSEAAVRAAAPSFAWKASTAARAAVSASVTWSGPKDLELRLRVPQVEAGGAPGRTGFGGPSSLASLAPCRLDRLLRRLDLRGQRTLWRASSVARSAWAVSSVQLRCPIWSRVAGRLRVGELALRDDHRLPGRGDLLGQRSGRLAGERRGRPRPC